MAHMYYNTFIAIAEDSRTSVSKIPVPRGAKPTVAMLQYEMLAESPFVHTQEDVLFEVWLARQDREGLAADEVEALREEYFSKGRACLRTSPLAKTHGFGFIFDEDGRVALVPAESDDYQRHLLDETLDHTRAMRSKRA